MENHTELEEPTLAASFDKLCQDFARILDSSDDTNSSESQGRITKTIKGLEEVTRLVSVIGMFSSNESVEEISSDELKYLLIPYMLGALWQINTSEDRKTICQLSLTYFQDFLQRCFDYGIIPSAPQVHEDNENKTEPRPKPAQELRNEKIRRIKYSKELESKIEEITDRQKKGEELDDELVRELYISKIRRDANKSENELSMIAQEIQLIKFAESRKAESSTSSDNKKVENSWPKNTPSTFIITRNDEQKKVFGLGYPALPVLTVEEFYQQRADAGIWPGGSHSHGTPPVTINSAPDTEDDGAEKDTLEELDHPDVLQRQREMDEYKDMHRRGWGNRANRS